MPKYNKESDWRLVQVAPVRCEYIQQEVSSFYSEWLIDTSRQENFATHENTFMYELVSFDYNWRPGCKAESKTINTLGRYSEAELAGIYNLLEEYASGRVVHAEIVSMNPRSRIRTHKDVGDALYLLRRFHVPIKTNNQAFFIVEDEQFFLREGIAYELNNSKYHSVKNNGEESRIHLIVDVLPSEYLSGVSFT